MREIPRAMSRELLIKARSYSLFWTGKDEKYELERSMLE